MINDQRLLLATRSHAIPASLLFLALVLISAKPVIAQPGDQRTQEQIRIDLNRRLTEINADLIRNPESGSSYMSRAHVYRELFFKIRSADERVSYSSMALADFDQALAFEPNNPTSLAERAGFRSFVDLRTGFDAIVADYLNAIRLTEEYASHNSGGRAYEDERIANYYSELSGVYLSRGEMLSRDAAKNIAEGRPRTEQYYSWDDFDKATAYAQKSVTKPFDLMKVLHTRLAKGDAAYKAREFALALDAYQSDEQYLGKDYNLLCENEISKEWCASNQRQLTLMFSIRRGRVYLSLREPEKALAELSVYFATAYHLECRDIFILRARAYLQLGDDERAAADQEKGMKFGTASCPFDGQ